MKLYNTLHKQIEEIKPQSAPTVTIYTCGPTVYDYPHIGNWFTFIRYDLLVRALRANGLQPKWVMNITDVGHLTSDADEGEDKLEKGAKREGKTAWDIAKTYSDYFLEGLTRLSFIQPDYLPKATDHIEEQIDLIKKLEAKGFTYKIDDGIYYDTSKFPRYADFAQLDLDEQQAGTRVALNPQKKNPNDFALWKFSPEASKRDMEWDSPWGKGFPGWHIECSAMSLKYLGETLDIHSGGIDHVPVHHTNEIAQSEAATGKTFANYWMHTNHVLVEGEKIAKSAQNGISLEAIEAKGFNLKAFRLLVLESHYRTQSKFSWDALEAASNRLKSYQAMADLRWQDIPGEVSDEYIEIFEKLSAKILEELTNDINTPQILAELSEAEPRITSGYTSSYKKGLEDFLNTFIKDTLGIDLLESHDITNEQKKIIHEREEARKDKDFNKSDELRGQLEKQGVSINDTPHGPIWYRL